MAMRRSHNERERASLASGALLRSRSQAPTICAAEASTRSQLLMKAVCSQVEVVDPPPPRGIGGSERVDENQQRQQPLFVELRLQEPLDLLERHAAALAADAAGRRDLDAEEAVALAVLARTSLEEPLQDVGGARNRMLAQPAAGVACGHRHRSYDSRRADVDCWIRYLDGSAQKRWRSSDRLEAPP